MTEPNSDTDGSRLVSKLPPDGGMAVIVGKTGVGKAAVLADIALGELLRGHQVIHLALREPAAHARSRYDQLLRGMQDAGGAEESLELARNRDILSIPELDLAVVDRHLSALAEVTDFRPTLMVVDGSVMEEGLHQRLEALRGFASERNMRACVGVCFEAEPLADAFPTAEVLMRVVPMGATTRLEPIRSVA